MTVRPSRTGHVHDGGLPHRPVKNTAYRSPPRPAPSVALVDALPRPSAGTSPGDDHRLYLSLIAVLPLVAALLGCLPVTFVGSRDRAARQTT